MPQFDYTSIPRLKRNAASIIGPSLIYPGGSGAYIITNYDSFHHWDVTADKGVISRKDELITLDIPAGEVAGIANLTVSRNGITDSVQITISENAVAKPSVVAPVNGAVDVVECPVIMLSDFKTYPANADSEKSVSVRIIDQQGNVVWELEDQVPGTELKVPKGVLSPAHTYRPQGRHSGNTFGYSEWSDMDTSFTTTDSFGPAFHGDIYQGDIVLGPVGGDWLLLAPAAKRTLKKWGLSNIEVSLKDISSASEPDDKTGQQNTDVLVSDTYRNINDGLGSIGSPAAEYCRSLGYDLPNKEELYFIWQSREVIDSVDGEGNTLGDYISYGLGGAVKCWSSSECHRAVSWTMDFNTKTMGVYPKEGDAWVLPVRRVPV
ncbi:hypothetical protein [Oceanospirillum sediminis]|uniref:Uncharacterized protein n=1 Tax=Oceanospirillum sediminis TaxID=2760088 RepID=A0A839ILZ8_9GAMM|nr:hypothetical protein [Oceanospirillum sediminis]MBB1485921.1 hypothetical protein [Oceanospirillum sediminis]